jgi:hypothetical protein
MWLTLGDERTLINLDHVRQLAVETASLTITFAAGEKVVIRSFASEADAKAILKHVSNELMTTDLPLIR